MAIKSIKGFIKMKWEMFIWRLTDKIPYVKELVAKNESADRLINTLEEEVTNLEIELSKMVDPYEIKWMQFENDDLKSKNERLEKENEQLYKDLRKMWEINERLETDNTELYERFLKLKYGKGE